MATPGGNQPAALRRPLIELLVTAKLSTDPLHQREGGVAVGTAGGDQQFDQRALLTC